VQMSINAITRELLLATFENEPRDDILLVPILRAGIAMWGEANEFFGFPETSFVWGNKEKGSDRVSVLWPKKNNMNNRQIIVLDPIIATGDTILQVYSNMAKHSTEMSSFKVISCYASPLGVKAILDKTKNVDLVVGCMAKTVDANGYLVPYTNGDMGDKLFGSIPDS
jgi:4a-hydroxytetrahydrobiopterin dehydratase